MNKLENRIFYGDRNEVNFFLGTLTKFVNLWGGKTYLILKLILIFYNIFSKKLNILMLKDLDNRNKKNTLFIHQLLFFKISYENF